jgi:endonuclease III
MNKNYNLPKFSDVMASLSPIRLPWENEFWSIGDWGKKHRAEIVKTNRNKQRKVEIFNTFVAALLQVVGTRGRYGQRIELMNEYFHNFTDITTEKAQEMLRKNKYPWISRGINVILESQALVEAPSFNWELYFQEAEKRAEDGFDDDHFLQIYGVGPKGRDFALGQFSMYWCAIDRHLAHILRRTGLIYHGSNDPDFGDNPSKRQQYKFMQRLIIRLSKETGWPTDQVSGWSPSEIDSSLWFFGQGICKDRPECLRCPIRNICLSFQNKGVNLV